ncbi:MAG: NAD(P)-dependent oxidoreductase [Candidatus Omnitrophica bacterium]|nr:NAD(P)-dependent oxidoreductase [Candidatus Omnitrophota bacterium]MCM8831808.1 NAD(P)-dependent oxidoreductase [Candidatus Omnitrophota bacterium]
MKKILLFGKNGKLGSAIEEVFSKDYSVFGLSSKDCDVCNFKKVKQLIKKIKPKIVINATVFGGIKLCEKNPYKAFLINSLFPRFLAKLSRIENFLLVHFSSDAVFGDSKKKFFVETDEPFLKNIYGATKYVGDCFVQAEAKNYYILRMSVLFGKTTKTTQFIDKALKMLMEGKKIINIYGDFVFSPTYSLDVAWQLKKLIEEKFPFGLYHIANSGKATFAEILNKIISNLNLKAKVQKVLTEVSDDDFSRPVVLRSIKLKPQRSWKAALNDYCNKIKKAFKL